MRHSCNDTKEKGWGEHRPGKPVPKLAGLELGKFYLRKTMGPDDIWHYNVVEVVDIPVDFLLVKGERLVYGRFVDPRDFTKRREGSADFHTIWWWGFLNPKRDVYYQLEVDPAETPTITNENNQTGDPATRDPATATA